MEIGLEVNVDKTKYMLISGDKNAGRRHSLRVFDLKWWKSSIVW